MPAIIQNAQQFLLNTDFPVDKVVVGNTATMTVAAASISTGVIAHTLPYAPLMWGSWSLTSDYAILYGLNSGPISSTPLTIGSPFDSLLKIYSDTTNMYFEGSNFTGSPITFHIRFYGLQPSTSDDDSPLTHAPSDNFQFNSDYNYTKLYLAGYIDQAEGVGVITTQTVSHNLGSMTQAIAWREYTSTTGFMLPCTYHDDGDAQAEDVSVSISSTNLTFQFSGGQPAMRVHYRIYLDN